MAVDLKYARTWELPDQRTRFERLNCVILSNL